MADRSRHSLVATLAPLLLAACGAEDAEPPNVTTNDLAEIVPLPPVPPASLDRAGLLDAIRAAASAFSAGTDDRAAQRDLIGRRFAIGLPFACPGVEDAGSQFALTVRPDGRSYEIRATPAVTADEAGVDSAGAGPAGQAEGGDQVETVEGFWITRPWLLAETCPPPGKPPPVAAPSGRRAETKDRPQRGAEEPEPVRDPAFERTAGIVQIITGSDSRVGLRAGRDYRVVVRLKDGEAPPPGVLMRIEGRLRAWPGGKAIRCLSRGASARPACIAAADVDRVAFVRSDNGEVLSEWVK